MEKRVLGTLETNAGHLQFVDITLDEALYLNPYAFTVFAGHCLFD
jgi:hypothetical protein